MLQLKLKKSDPELEALFQIRPPVRVKIFLVKRRYLKRLEELSDKSSNEKPQLEDPTEEQEKWYESKMKAPAWTWTWRTWDK